MALLIDGYNLLHASGILPRGLGPGTLERARAALLTFLASAIEAAELPNTTIVFDAKEAPPGLPDIYDHGGMIVRFARDYEDADLLLIELIRTDFAPRKLTVVSSDHQVQRAARRRRAKAIDSDRWCAELLRRHRLPELRVAEAETKPPAPLSEAEVRSWLKEFGEVEMKVEAFRPRRATDAKKLAAENANSTGPEEDETVAPDDQGKANDRGTSHADSVLDEAKRLAEHDAHLANPFPPGYGEDLLENDP